MMTAKTPSIAEQYHAGLSTLGASFVDVLLEIVRYQGNQVVQSAKGNYQIVIPKSLVNSAFEAKGISAKVTNDLYLQGIESTLKSL